MKDQYDNKYSKVRKITIEFEELPKDWACEFIINILRYMDSHNHRIILKRLEVNGGNFHA